MPKAGMAMEEGTIVQWFIKVGERVEEGEPLLEIETDKVAMEIESPASGVLLRILRNEGEVVPVTQTIGWIGEPGEEIEEEPVFEAQAFREEIPARSEAKELVAAPGKKVLHPAGARVAATPLARRLAAQKGIDLIMITPSGSRGEVKARDIESVAEISATPLARKMAKDLGIDLAGVDGTGFGGKIREADILAVGKPSSKDSAGAVSPREPVRVPMRGMRKRIAERMLQSHLQAPPVTLNVNVDVTDLLEIRKCLNDSLDSKISINDFLLKVTAIALREHPAINASIDGDEIVYHPDINLGMAVALEEGLITPVIRHADTLSLLQLSKVTKELSEKARGGGLLPDDYMGGTFTVSNLGVYDIVYFTPIINPPESGILGVCAIEDRVRINGEKIEKRKVMGLSLTFDHRVIDGAQSAVFLKRIKSLLENPLELMAQ